MDPGLTGHRRGMPGVEYDGDSAAPSHRSELIAGAVLVLVLVVALLEGVAAVLLLALVAVLVGLAVGVVLAITRAARGEDDRSGDHEMPSLRAAGGPAAQRAESGHVSPSATRAP
jgi:hypothetical protein